MCVKVSPELMLRVEGEVAWAFQSNPTGTAEVAGILLGKRDTRIDIVDAEPLFLMSQRDRSHTLSGPGTREFQHSMAALNSASGAGLSVLGWYRSHIGDGFELTDEDQALTRSCFNGSAHVVLLIKPSADGAHQVRLFLGGDGRELSELVFSDDASTAERTDDASGSLHKERKDEVGDRLQRPGVNAALPEAASVPVSQSEASPPPFVAPAPRWSPGFVVFVAVAIILLGLLGYVVVQRTGAFAFARNGPETPAEASTHPTEFAVRVEAQGDNLRLTWDRSAQVLAVAKRGTLTIQEGNSPQREFALDENLLKTGSVVYRPVGRDVLFRLVIFGGGDAEVGRSVVAYP